MTGYVVNAKYLLAQKRKREQNSWHNLLKSRVQMWFGKTHNQKTLTCPLSASNSN